MSSSPVLIRLLSSLHLFLRSASQRQRGSHQPIDHTNLLRDLFPNDTPRKPGLLHAALCLLSSCVSQCSIVVLSTSSSFSRSSSSGLMCWNIRPALNEGCGRKQIEFVFFSVSSGYQTDSYVQQQNVNCCPKSDDFKFQLSTWQKWKPISILYVCFYLSVQTWFSTDYKSSTTTSSLVSREIWHTSSGDSRTQITFRRRIIFTLPTELMRRVWKRRGEGGKRKEQVEKMCARQNVNFPDKKNKMSQWFCCFEPCRNAVKGKQT